MSLVLSVYLYFICMILSLLITVLKNCLLLVAQWHYCGGAGLLPLFQRSVNCMIVRSLCLDFPFLFYTWIINLLLVVGIYIMYCWHGQESRHYPKQYFPNFWNGKYDHQYLSPWHIMIINISNLAISVPCSYHFNSLYQVFVTYILHY